MEKITLSLSSQVDALQYIKERLDRFMSVVEKRNIIQTTKDYDIVLQAIETMAESVGLAECNRCGEFFNIDDLQVYREDDTNYSEYVCNSCWK